ncbi:MAG: choice-of-anchor A family protein [Fimbriimonadaceae bacterium]|nr:choice-of-anchor A family protein [Fimbriimonadaceae bacterium]
MKLRTTAALVLPMALLGTAQAQLFGQADPYNVFVFGNFNSWSSDTEGKLAAGGNVTLENYDIGLKNPGGTALVVGGNFGLKNGTVRGNAFVGGSKNILNANIQNGWTNTNPVNFSSARTQLMNLSSLWAAQNPSGRSWTQWGTVNLSGTNSGVNTFRIASSIFNGANSVNIDIPTGATAVITVTGSSVNLPNIGYNLRGSQDPNGFRNVVWNINQATAVSMQAGLNGTLFAPNANVTGNWGVVQGQLIANSFNGPTQINWVKYNPPQQPVPEPMTMTLLGGAAAAFIARRRRAARK